MLRWWSARQQQRKERQALELQQKRQKWVEYQLHLKQQQERERQARISNPKCMADFMLRHEAEADEGGKCARLGCCVCGCPALLIVRGELQPRQPAAHPHGHGITIMPPSPTSLNNSSSSSSNSNSQWAAAGVAADVPSATGTSSDAELQLQFQQRQRQQQQQMEHEAGIEVVPALATSTHAKPQAEMVEGAMTGCESDTRTTFSIMSGAPTMWRVGMWPTILFKVMGADDMLPRHVKPGSKGSWQMLMQAAAAPVTLMQMLLARRVV